MELKTVGITDDSFYTTKKFWRVNSETTGACEMNLRSGLTILTGMFLHGSIVFGEPITQSQRQNLQGSDSTIQPLSQLDPSYGFSNNLNPFYLRGDFNGDGKIDLAALIRENTLRRYGIAIFHQGETEPILLGAGFEIGNGGLDFQWMDIWRVSGRKSIPSKKKGEKPRKLIGEAIHVEKGESASALIYWDGEEYQWHQLGD
jgi:hypothetical protein